MVLLCCQDSVCWCVLMMSHSNKDKVERPVQDKLSQTTSTFPLRVTADSDHPLYYMSSGTSSFELIQDPFVQGNRIHRRRVTFLGNSLHQLFQVFVIVDPNVFRIDYYLLLRQMDEQVELWSLFPHLEILSECFRGEVDVKKA